ncbi:hypothetical protein TRIP_C21356 [Candidatus Zixiibacteriota bacterium]|nr:hypothetical protein TRIP_C21356 [candidate division Zixibacteria bacterium]
MDDELLKIWPKEKFYNRVEFIGRLEAAGKSLDKLHIIIQYSQLTSKPIRGIIIGNIATFGNLIDFMKLPTRKFILKSSDDSGNRIFSDAVYISRAHSSGSSENLRFVAGELILDNLQIRNEIRANQTGERHLTFYISGPRQLWPSYGILSTSFLGNMNYDVHETLLEVAPDLPCSIEARPVFKFEQDVREDINVSVKDVYALHLTTAEPINNLTNEQYIDLGKALADDLTLLLSFIAREWISWFSYAFEGAGEISEYIRESRERKESKIDINNIAVPLHRIREFLKIGLGNLRLLRESGIDLSTAIAYLINGNQLYYVQERFSAFFMSLEIIKDYFASEKNLYNVLPNKEFNKLKVKLKEFIRQEVPSESAAKKMQGKINELNRVSFRALFDAMCEHYDVIWQDLYPDGSSLSVIETRNILFHTGKKIDIELLYKDEIRIHSFVERLILKILGWNEKVSVPNEAIRMWLSS